MIPVPKLLSQIQIFSKHFTAFRCNWVNENCYDLTGIKTINNKLLSEIDIICGICNLNIVHPMLVYCPDKII